MKPAIRFVGGKKIMKPDPKVGRNYPQKTGVLSPKNGGIVPRKNSIRNNSFEGYGVVNVQMKWLPFHYDRVAENFNCINVQFGCQ
jgi:hypothetical protein